MRDERNARGAAAAAMIAVLALSACTADRQPAITTSASVGPAPAQPGMATFTAFGTPCPTVGDRTGTKLDTSLDMSISTTVECTYGDPATFPHVTSIGTINKPGHPKGAPAEVARQMFAALRSKANTNAADGVAIKDKPALGDESIFVISLKDNVALLIVRSDNALIQASATVDARGDREAELAELQALEPTVTELATALLAELR